MIQRHVRLYICNLWLDMDKIMKLHPWLMNVIKYLYIYPGAIYFDTNLLEEMVYLMQCQKKSHSLKYFDAYCAASL